jgi:glycosyltransferase involved in cell wall biosynthesis
LLDSPWITGGGERMAIGLTKELDPDRFERFLCATRSVEGPTLEDELKAAGVRMLTLNRRSKGALWAWSPLIKLLRAERIDILHAHKFGSNLWGTIIGRLVRVPVIVAHEQSWASASRTFGGPRLRCFLDREVIARGADCFFAVSHADRRRMIDVEGIDPGRIRLLPNAIATARPNSHRSVREELGIGAEDPVVGTVCQLRPEKALEVLIEATKLLRPRFPTLKVLIAGDGPEEPKLRDQIADSGLMDAVLLLGTRTDVPDLLAALDIAVCCSDFEGTPLSVMEYMNAALPVVATRVGGLPELVTDGENGLLTGRRDPRGLSEALATLLSDGALRDEMGRLGLDRQRRDFDVVQATRRVELVYEELFMQTRRARTEGWRSIRS